VAQVAIARGERLALDPLRLLTPNGHAIECRVYAEDPDAGFLPSPGHLTHVQPPAGPGVRDDSGVVTGSDIPLFYDPLISKVAVWGGDRPAALARMARALAEYDIRGVRTTISFFRRMLQDVNFRNGNVDTTFVDRLLADGASAVRSQGTEGEAEAVAALAVALQVTEAASGDRGRRNGASAIRPDGWTARARAEALREWPRA
jgi:acetyl-CoA carboxylase biotin carboxylase subunit